MTIDEHGIFYFFALKHYVFSLISLILAERVVCDVVSSALTFFGKGVSRKRGLYLQNQHYKNL
jgi:hypothetical protein